MTNIRSRDCRTRDSISAQWMMPLGAALGYGPWGTKALAPGPKETGQAMEIDDDATQHPEDSQIWLGIG